MKIYLAIPYSGIEEESFLVANKITAQLMQKGHIVFSPISHNHCLAVNHNLPKGWEFWKEVDTCFIEWCDELYVVELLKDGQNKILNSKGVTAEMIIANTLDKPIHFIKETL